MIDRRNRVVLGLLGLLLMAGGGLSACLGSRVFGADRSRRDIFDHTVVQWWHEGGWKSFAVVVAIGVVAFVVGLRAVLLQLRRNDGGRRTPDVSFRPKEGAHGETTLRSPALSHALERDLVRIADVRAATVGLFGDYPSIELRAVLDVGDGVELQRLPEQVGEVLSRMEATAGVRPDPVQMTLRFKAAERERQLI